MHKSYGLNELREMFLKFFETKGYLRPPSLSLTPQNDASLLLVNSGMAPTKPWFTGGQESSRHRVTTCQKCIRTGDIENIGHVAHHGIYLEMPGNFSFGDYFKRDVIHWAWGFLTSPEWTGLEADRLYPSVFAGNKTIPADDEAFHIWNEKISIPAERIFRSDKEDSFWEHGSGPCSPYSETYYNRGLEWGCGKPGCTADCDCDRYIEAWNIVFSQFDNDGEDRYTGLRQENIDTGMGLERSAYVCQNVVSPFDVDTVTSITNKTPEIIHAHYGEAAAKDVSLRVITDHIRSSVSIICNGVFPSNEGRGYMLRCLLRRTARHGKLLDVNEPFLYEVCGIVIREDEGHYLELRERQDYTTKAIRTKEENFTKTIGGDLKTFGDIFAKYKAKGESTFSGADAFKLYDTRGFPIDLTLEMVKEQGMKLDEVKPHNRMDEQRQRTWRVREALSDPGWVGVEFGGDVLGTQFAGYDHTAIDGAKVVALVMESEQAEGLMPGVEAIAALDRTPFYVKMSGQAANHGVISAGGVIFQVTDVQKDKDDRYMHTGRLTQGALKVGGTASIFTDVRRRKAVVRAHSVTHLLDAVFRKVLGDHTYQVGSLVESGKLCFDFAHFAALTAEKFSQVSVLVNGMMLEGYEVSAEVLPVEEAKQCGAITLFGEKYGDAVRVVGMSQGFPVEFCGSTHLDNTAKVGVSHVDSESSVASGVRRIEATTDLKSLETMNRAQPPLFETVAVFKVKPAELCEKAEQNMVKLREVRRTVKKFWAGEAIGETECFLMGDHDLGEPKVFIVALLSTDAAKLHQMGDMLRDKQPNMVAVLSAVNDSKITSLTVCGKETVSEGVKTGDIIRNVITICGGKDGGKPDSAMDGGDDLLELDDMLVEIDDLVVGKLRL